MMIPFFLCNCKEMTLAKQLLLFLKLPYVSQKEKKIGLICLSSIHMVVEMLRLYLDQGPEP